MTKRTLLVLMMSILFTLVFAQTYLTESFEGEWTGTPAAPANWTQVAGPAGTGSGSDIAWAKSTHDGTAWLPAGNGTKPAGAQSGTSVAWYNDYNAQAGQRDSLKTPVINLATATNPRVSFYYFYSTGSAKLRVYASADGVSNWTEISPTAGLGATGAVWTKAQYSLSAYNGGNVTLAFVTVGAWGSHDIWFDNVVVEETPQIPPLAATLGFPGDAMTTVNNPLLKWSAATTGELATGYKVYVGTSNTFADPVATVTTTSYQTTGLLNGTTYYWKVVPYNTYGDATGNSVYSFTTATTAQLAEGFEGTVFPPAGWAVNPTTSTWVSSTVAIEGVKSASVSTGTNTTADLGKKLITPKLSITASSTIKFLTATSAAATNAKYIQVMSSPDKVIWTAVGTPITVPYNVWTQFSVDLSSLAGQNVYLALSAYTQSTSGTVYVDQIIGPDFTIEAPGVVSTPVPADAAINVNAIPTLSWAAPSTGGLPTSYKVYVDTVNPPVALAATVNTLSYTSTAVLNYNTTYYWSVVPTNTAGDATGNPVWSFTVMADPTLTVPMLQDFTGLTSATFPPLNWERKAGLLAAPTVFTGTTSAWSASTGFCNDPANANGVGAKINVWSTTKKDWLITPPINLGTEGGLQLEFDLALTDYNNSAAAELPAPDDKFAVVISTDNGITWTSANVLHLWDNVAETAGSDYDSIATVGEHIVIPLTATGIVRLGFYTESTISNADSDLHVDNIQVRPTPTLPIFAVTPVEKNFGDVILNGTTAAQTFTVSNTGTGSLVINSIALAGANADQFILTDTNTYPATVSGATTITVNVAFHPTSVGPKAATLVITDALTRVAHEVALSGNGVDPSITIPYAQNFDLATVPTLPIGWVSFASQTGAAARPWVVQNSATIGNHSAPNFVGSFYHSTYPKNEWLVTPNVMLTAGTTYRVKFWVKAPGWQGTPEKMKVVVGNAQTLEAMTGGTVLWDDANMLITAYTEKMFSYTPTTTGAYYFGWHSYSAADVDYIAVDDISIEVGPVENPPTALTATAGNAFVSLSWTAPSAGSTGTLAGYKVYRNGTSITANPVTGTTYEDNTVANGTTYSYYVTAVYTAPDGESAPSNTVAATPVAPVLYPPTNLQASVVADDVTLSWSAAGPEGEWISHGGEFSTSIGTNSAANFSVAHRFSAAQLTELGVAGGQLHRVKFIGHVPEATYTVKVWTGGTGTPLAPGTEVASQAVTAINVDDWTEVVLTTPVTIPTTGELWFGYNVNTPSGHPAGADEGPQLEAYGNVMYFNNAWTTLTALASTLTRNWCIGGYAVDVNGQVARIEMPRAPERVKAVMELTPVVNNSVLQAIETPMVAHTRTENRNLTGYKVYRGTTLLTATPLAPNVLTYQDMNVANGNYTYNVTAVYTDGESVPASVDVVVNTNLVINQFPWDEGFEGAWPTTGWTSADVDGDNNNWYQMINSGTSNYAHSGTKCAASASYINGTGALTPNNYLITPKIQLPTYPTGQSAKLKFWVAAQDPDWPAEHYSVMVSTTTPAVSAFTTTLNSTTLSSGDWVQKTIQLTNYSGQAIYLAFRHHDCTDQFVMKLDDVRIEMGTANDDQIVKATRLNGNYPNPFNPVTNISFSVKERADVSIEVYNVKGQKVKTLVNEVMNQGTHTVSWTGKDDSNKDVASGIYFYRMKSGKYTATGKMVLMK